MHTEAPPGTDPTEPQTVEHAQGRGPQPALEAAAPNPLVHVSRDGGRRADRGALEEVPAAPPAMLRHLWSLRDFRVFLVGEAVSATGDAVTLTALPLLVLALTGSGLAMGVVGVLQMLPDLVFGLVAGALADRWDRRRMMLYADIGRAALTALIPLSMLLGLPTMGVILLVTFPISTLRVVFMAAYTGAVPNLVGREQIGPANSFMEAAFSFGFIIGPGAAGFLATLIGPGPTLAVDAASFLASAAAISAISRSLRADRREDDQRNLVHEVVEGIAFVARHQILRAAVAYWSWVSIATAALIPAVTYYVTKDRGLPSTALGLVIAAEALGYFTGAIAGARVTKNVGIGRVLIAANIMTGLGIFAFGQLTDLPLLALVSFLAGASNALVLIGYITLRAMVTPDELLGRVGSTARMVSLGLQPIGMLVGGVLLDAAGGGVTLAAMGVATIAASLVFSLSRTLRTAELQAVAV